MARTKPTRPLGERRAELLVRPTNSKKASPVSSIKLLFLLSFLSLNCSSFVHQVSPVFINQQQQQQQQAHQILQHRPTGEDVQLQVQQEQRPALAEPSRESQPRLLYQHHHRATSQHLAAEQQAAQPPISAADGRQQPAPAGLNRQPAPSYKRQLHSLKKLALLGNSTSLSASSIRANPFYAHPSGLPGKPSAAAAAAEPLASLAPPASNPKRAGLLEKICIGTSNRMSAQHNKSDHYQNLVERYKNCTYVIGNLELTWLDATSPSGAPADLSFLESIREITGYLLIAYVNVDRIRMPNLQIIRGRDLFKLNTDEKEEFALVMIENELRQLELPNLREILAGSVGSYNNRNLCHIRTINWDEILNWPMYRSVFVYNGTEPECPPCDQSCQGSCWGEGAEMCQKFSKVGCSQACGQNGRCFGPTQNECCHAFCAGGCLGANQTDCLACKNFYDDGSCIHECPSMMRYNPSKFLWEPNPHGKYAFGATCVKECPEHMLRDSGACVRVCPPNKRSLNGECVSCGGPCPKNCQGVELVHSGNIDQLINCTVVEGSLTILDESFTGFTELLGGATLAGQAGGGGGGAGSPASGSQAAAAAASAVANTTSNPLLLGVRHKPMHPSRLEVFKTLREITGYLKIEAKHEDFKSLAYFTNLKTIDGRQTTDTFHALSIKRSSLISLNLRSLRKIRSGKIIIEENPELCFADTIDWHQIDINRRDDVTIRNNAETSRCRALNLLCHDQCAQDGCWGPGPDECLSCNNYKVDDYCVVNCGATESLGWLAYEESSASRLCKRCHSECRLGCTGVEARHCLQCKNVKDGPYCVPECPSHKYNNNGTCAECDKSCADGCTGPSNRLGEGGCNSCAKAIIRSAGEPARAPFDVSCIRADESCPDGFYQEYVVGSSQPEYSPLKASAGRPVCRKCHHRCKRCIGMGTHKTVCECAKYVAGEQCEDLCPRDYFADEESRQCVKCSPECNGCFGPTEADCLSCRVYRIYYEANYTAATGATQGGAPESPGAGSGEPAAPVARSQQLKFNCTAQCPADKPHRISESNMLDPYCSEDLGVDIESARNSLSASVTFWVLLIIASGFTVCLITSYVENIRNDKTVKLTMTLSGMDDVEPLDPSNYKPNLAPLRSIKETELRKGRVLGSGFGGTVYQGFWYPEGHEDKVRRPVAIKVLRDNGQSNMNKEFLDEAYIMASVNHPNLVRLLAVCMTPNQLMLVTRLMPLGCLLDYVKKNRAEISSKNLLEWGKQIAKGMAYLEEQRMVHRDLALRNVLLQTSGRACISDFGLAKLLDVDQSEYQSGGGRLPIKWLAPECFREKKFTHKSDVWAFGVTIWELVTFGQRPFEEYETRDVPMAIERGARLQQPNYVSAEVYKVMIACWFYNADDRPNFKSLVKEFAKFARDPERFLICGAKGVELTRGHTRELGAESADDDENDFSSALDTDDDADTATQQSPLASSQPPLSAMPDLTPSTHNRLNEMFGFELRHQHQHHHQQQHHNHHGHQQRASESESMAQSAHLSTPMLKKLGVFNSQAGSERVAEFEEEVFAKSSREHHFAPTKTSNMLITDANNNLIANNNSCWSVHHTVSTNSLGQRSEQPTDMYDYLLPSPHTEANRHTFSNFCTPSYDDRTLPVSQHPIADHNNRPPHSAGLAANVTNEEYFLTRSNYVNQKLEAGVTRQRQHLHQHHQHRLSTSNGNIPQSLV